MSVRLHSGIIPAVREWVRRCTAAGIRIKIISGYRSPATQAALYRKWLASGRVGNPVAPPGRSWHEYGLAVDFIATPPRYEHAGRLAESLGFRWGGRFKDKNHIDAAPAFGTSSGAD